MPNRIVCSVLDEMRKCHETRNYSYLLGLIEEAQTLVNRMEASLYDRKDAEEYLPERIKQLKEEIKALKKEKKELENAPKIGESEG